MSDRQSSSAQQMSQQRLERDSRQPLPDGLQSIKCTNMFDSTPLCPPDAVFGLSEEYKRDPSPDKINLTVGVYQDESGLTNVLDVVKSAERILLEDERSKTYLPIDGLREYNEAIARLMLGDGHPALTADRTVTAQTPGGTAALRVAGEMLHGVLGVKTIWMSQPTWANHPKVFESAGLKGRDYDYLDDRGTGLDFDRMSKSLQSTMPGDAILLHVVCHNPTGVDPEPEQWRELFELIAARKLIPVFDFAYQGFGSSIDEDAFPIRYFSETVGEAFICNSFSKNFNLYSERVGGITAVAATSDSTKAMLSQIKAVIRVLYSNPPQHGAAIVNTVLNDARLRSDWEQELGNMRERINRIRREFANTMRDLVPNQDFQFVARQRGMFSYSGLTAEQVEVLKSQYSIYILRSGRINVAGINSSNIGRLCEAIAEVLR